MQRPASSPEFASDRAPTAVGFTTHARAPGTLRAIHLIPERLVEADATGGTAAGWLAPLSLNHAPAWLVSSVPAPRLCETPPAAHAPAALVETVRLRGPQLALLVTFPRTPPAHVNGHPAPMRALLRAGDCFGWGADFLFHVTIFSRPQIGPPPESVLSQPCAICLVPFRTTDTVYVCGCGQVMHAEPTPDRLQCAQTRGTCARCHRPVRLEPHYEWQPEV